MSASDMFLGMWVTLYQIVSNIVSNIVPGQAREYNQSSKFLLQ